MVITISVIPNIIIIPNVLAQNYVSEVENAPESSTLKIKADKLFKIGVEQFRTGTFDKALETYKEVLSIHKKLGDFGGVAKTLNNIGDVYINQREYLKAIEVLQQALTIHRQINDRSGAA